MDTLLDDPNQRSSGGVTMLMNAANSGQRRMGAHTHTQKKPFDLQSKQCLAASQNAQRIPKDPKGSQRHIGELRCRSLDIQYEWSSHMYTPGLMVVLVQVWI